jgi:hypothetical protein
MRRVTTSLRTDRPVPADVAAAVVHHSASWGFHALDGLPDLAEASLVSREQWTRFGRPHLTSGALPMGIDDEVKAALAEIEARARSLGARRRIEQDGPDAPAMSVYEVEVCDAMAARRDAAVRLQQVLADDVAAYEGGVKVVQQGGALDFLVPAVGGNLRRSVSDAMADFEAARHRFRLALVAVAVDNGMTGAQIGEAFAFSRQLASRYLKEAGTRWPELRAPATRRAKRT